ncbi:MAG: hypothetical protein NDJ24_07925 [Alphaproteobacteria bacterium]|nr:hypothetical protein [Alphaproteobacteria bacterium]
MFKHKLLVSALCAGFGLAGYTLPSQAQLLDGDGVAYSSEYRREPLRSVDITLTRGENLMPGQFVIHAQDQGAFSSGCAKISNIPVKVEYIANFIRLTYSRYIFDSREQLKGSGTACNTPMPPPSAEVVVDKATLLEQGIQKVRFMYEGQPIEADLELTEDRVRLWPALSREGLAEVSFGNLRTKPSTVWFYPENTVILNVPNATTDKDLAGLRQKVDALAAGRGLKPLEDHLQGFKSPLKDKAAFYYVATNDRYAQAQGELLDYIQVDSVKYGLEGDEPVQKSLPVHVRKPRPTE